MRSPESDERTLLLRAAYLGNRSRMSAFLGKLPLLWFRWLRQSRNATCADESGTFLDYLRYQWQLDDQSQVPVEFFSKLVRRAIPVPAERLQRR